MPELEEKTIPYIIIEYIHQIGSFISNNRSSLDVIRPVSWIFQQKLVCFIGRISNDFWWNWHLFYRLCTIRLKTGKGYFINSFPAPPFCLQSMKKKMFIFIVLQRLNYEIIPSFWPILSQLNPPVTP